MKAVVALDQGTTSCRAMVFAHDGSVLARAQEEFKQHYPQPGWVEHDPEEIWETQKRVTEQAVAASGLDVSDIASVGITNQRETIVCWNKETGESVGRAIVWQDRRTAEFCKDLEEFGKAPLIRERTGLLLDPYFSGTKLVWLMENDPTVARLAEQGQLAVGTIDSWLVWKLTNGAKHVTDATNASRTLLLSIHTLEWDQDLLELFEIPLECLPKVIPNSGVFAEVTGLDCLKGVPIGGMAGDQHAALFGQACFDKGMAKNTYGTGCFLLMNTGSEPVLSQNNLLTTIAWQIEDEVTYALEGSIFIGGAAVQWLRDGLGIIKESSEVEALATSVDSSDGVYLVPAFAGLGAPHWNADARGSLFGLTRGSTAAHIARATLESIAYQSHDVLKAMEKDAGIPLKELRVDGGATNDKHLMQFQSDILDRPVIQSAQPETTALGAAYLAGLAVGFWKGEEDISNAWSAANQYSPEMEEKKRIGSLNGWNRAVKAALAWAGDPLR